MYYRIQNKSLDNINTRTALESLRELIGEANIYMANARGANRAPNRMILKNIASYITYLLKVSTVESGDPVEPI